MKQNRTPNDLQALAGMVDQMTPDQLKRTREAFTAAIATMADPAMVADGELVREYFFNPTGHKAIEDFCAGLVK